MIQPSFADCQAAGGTLRTSVGGAGRLTTGGDVGFDAGTSSTGAQVGKTTIGCAFGFAMRARGMSIGFPFR